MGLMAAAGAIRRKRRKRRAKLKNIPLTLSSATMPANSVQDTVVGNILNIVPGAYVSITDTAGGRFKLVGTQIKAGATAAVAGSYTILLSQGTSALGFYSSSIVITVA
jgi:hypothetical protein